MSDDSATRDVTARTRSDRRLAPGRDEFVRVNELNDVIRGVNAAVVSTTTRGEMAEAICEQLADTALYRTVCMADCPTWTGNADHWTDAGVPTDEGPAPPTLEEDAFDEVAPAGAEPAPTLASAGGDRAGDWTVVPITHDHTVYGALGLLSSNPPVGDHEREVLGELGGVIGHAINAVETRRLLADAAVIELRLRTENAATPLVDAARRADCRFELAGFVPATENGSVVYLHVEDATVETASKQLAAASDGDIRTIRENENGDGGSLEWTVGGDNLLGRLVDYGANVTGVTANGEAANYTVEVASSTDVRTLLDRVQQVYPETRLDAKCELDRPIDPAEGISAGGIEELTDRQREVLEAAYRAGYYRWPRDSTAEEVAETLDIAGPTLHGHLRKAEEQLLGELFDADSSLPRDRDR